MPKEYYVVEKKVWMKKGEAIDFLRHLTVTEKLRDTRPVIKIGDGEYHLGVECSCFICSCVYAEAYEREYEKVCLDGVLRRLRECVWRICKVKGEDRSFNFPVVEPDEYDSE